MSEPSLSTIYRDYLDCLNKQDWDNLELFVHENVERNGQQINLSGYREMLESNYSDIPDLKFTPEFVLSEPPYVASRLRFDCTPTGEFLGLRINGKRISFAENVFYEFRADKIVQVWSVIDKAAIEAQL